MSEKITTSETVCILKILIPWIQKTEMIAAGSEQSGGEWNWQAVDCRETAFVQLMVNKRYRKTEESGVEILVCYWQNYWETIENIRKYFCRYHPAIEHCRRIIFPYQRRHTKEETFWKLLFEKEVFIVRIISFFDKGWNPRFVPALWDSKTTWPWNIQFTHSFIKYWKIIFWYKKKRALMLITRSWTFLTSLSGVSLTDKVYCFAALMDSNNIQDDLGKRSLFPTITMESLARLTTVTYVPQRKSFIKVVNSYIVLEVNLRKKFSFREICWHKSYLTCFRVQCPLKGIKP